MRRLFLFLGCFIMILKAGAQNTVSGKVLDARDNTPVQNVNVSIKGGQTLTTTDQNGQFTVNAGGNAILVFSAVGFVQKEMAANSSPLIVVLEISQKSLQEIIVTGYTTQNKR